MSASEILANSFSADAALRHDAESKLEALARDNLSTFMATLMPELTNENNPLPVRNAAALNIKNAIVARDANRQQELNEKWLALPQETRNGVKHGAMATLGSPQPRAGTFAAQVISAIAAIEVPAEQWLDLITQLLTFASDGSNVGLRMNALTAIGQICEVVLSFQRNPYCRCARCPREEPSPEVQGAAITALLNSLEFIRDNFEREGERNYLMQVVCEATQSENHPVQVGAFECLVKIMSLYYDKMGFYMERALFGLTVVGMKNPDEKVALQAVEFWSTVAEEEIELKMEEAEALEYGDLPERENKKFATTALNDIVPVLLQLLTQQEEDADEDEWNISMAAGTCLALLAQAVDDAIVPVVLPFIETNIKHDDWHLREAAVMVFGSILEGPDPNVLAGLVSQALPVLIAMMADSNAAVKDTTAWTLGRICELLVGSVNIESQLQALVTALVVGLEDRPRIIANSCWALMSLAEQLSPEPGPDGQPAATSTLSPFYQGIVDKLLVVTEKPTNESNFRTAAYEALNAYIANASADTFNAVSQITLTVLQRMETLLNIQNELLNIDDRSNWAELQSNFCSVIISVIRKMGAQVKPLADRIMTLTLRLVQAAGKQSTILEDGFLVVGTMSSALGQDIQPYLEAFLPIIVAALKNHEDAALCTVCIGTIGDIARALQEKTVQYAAAFISLLLESLQSQVMGRNVKIQVLACFGDVALSIGPEFAPYLETAMTVLKQAGEIQPNPMDYEMVDYVAQLREGILDAYVGIVAGFKSADKSEPLLPYVQTMLGLCARALSDEERPDTIVRAAFGLIGDLADLYSKGQIKPLLTEGWLTSALQQKPKGAPQETKRVLKYARESVRRAIA
ncbi:ribosomal protein import innucleus [Rhizoctonia solani]|uniref:Importin-95 n=1 Tax=Rhizoctonia solani TaxID=456999 RepID=A0A8H7IBV7_9AGAM|nr:ribosomal protein import innucleus [Rhizoctonia solani]